MSGKLRRLLTAIAVIGISAVLFLALNQLSNTDATTYTLSSELTLSDSREFENPDFTTTLVLPIGDSNFAGSGAAAVTFASGGWCVADHDSDCDTVDGDNLPTGSAVPVGTIVGESLNTVKLALQSVSGSFNGTCNQNFPVPFTFLEGIPDDRDGTISTSGTTDIFFPLSEDSDNDGIANHVELWPSYLSTLLDPDDDVGDNPVFPIARYTADTVVSNTTVILQLLVFSPGALTAFPGQPWQSFSIALGYPTLTVLQDPQQSNNSDIADFCTPLVNATTILGTTLANSEAAGADKCNECAVFANVVGGATLHKNASATSGLGESGTHLARTISQSERDTDSDGFENTFDSCRDVANADGDPRTNNGTDDDGLDSACDPNSNATTGKNLDQDGDGWANRLDNCPLDSNASQDDSDIAQGNPVADGGPPEDGIGVACDSGGTFSLSPTVPDGHYHQVTVKSFACNSAAGIDDDGDGWCKVIEDSVGTSDSDDCGTDALPVDFNDDGAVNNTDRGAIVSAFLGNDTSGRFDLNADTDLTNVDRAILVIAIGFTCTP